MAEMSESPLTRNESPDIAVPFPSCPGADCGPSKAGIPSVPSAQEEASLLKLRKPRTNSLTTTGTELVVGWVNPPGFVPSKRLSLTCLTTQVVFQFAAIATPSCRTDRVRHGCGLDPRYGLSISAPLPS